MKRIIAQARKEITQVWRDRLTLTLALLLPLLLLALMGTAISLTVTDLPIVVQDLDKSPASRAYIDAFRSSLTYRIVEMPNDEQPEQSLLSNRARAAIIIPEHFERDIQRGNDAQVQILIDASGGHGGGKGRGGEIIFGGGGGNCGNCLGGFDRRYHADIFGVDPALKCEVATPDRS